MLAVHLDNWLFFVFAAVALLFRWLSSAANKTTTRSDEPEERSTFENEEPPPPSVSQGSRRDSDAEKVRKFLEALGQPTVSMPPPPATPRTDVPPRPLAPVRPPLETTIFPRRKQPPPVPKIRLPEQITTPSYQQKEFKAPTVEPIFEVQERGPSPAPPMPASTPAKAYAAMTQPKPEIASTDVSVVQLLRSPGGLRNAIILREIFGPPRGMQPLDVIGNA